MKNKEKRRNIYINDLIWKKAKKDARKKDITISELIRRLLTSS